MPSFSTQEVVWIYKKRFFPFSASDIWTCQTFAKCSWKQSKLLSLLLAAVVVVSKSEKAFRNSGPGTNPFPHHSHTHTHIQQRTQRSVIRYVTIRLALHIQKFCMTSSFPFHSSPSFLKHGFTHTENVKALLIQLKTQKIRMKNKTSVKTIDLLFCQKIIK